MQKAGGCISERRTSSESCLCMPGLSIIKSQMRMVLLHTKLKAVAGAQGSPRILWVSVETEFWGLADGTKLSHWAPEWPILRFPSYLPKLCWEKKENTVFKLEQLKIILNCCGLEEMWVSLWQDHIKNDYQYMLLGGWAIRLQSEIELQQQQVPLN